MVQRISGWYSGSRQYISGRECVCGIRGSAGNRYGRRSEEEAQDAGETEGTENTEVTSEPVQETSDTDQVVIYHTNDIHGAFEAAEGGSVGVAKAATLKKETENALLVDAGTLPRDSRWCR